MKATHPAETPYAFSIGTDIGVTTTQHIPFITEAALYNAVITIR